MKRKENRWHVPAVSLRAGGILAALFAAVAFTTPAEAFRAESGIRIDPEMMTEIFGDGVTHHQTIDAVASGDGAASVEAVDAVPRLRVHYAWAPGFERIDNRLGVSNYLHLRGQTPAGDRSIRFTTQYNSTGQSGWAGIGASGNADQGFMRVSGDDAWYLGNIGGNWNFGEIAFGRLTATGDEPVGARNEAFIREEHGVTYAARAVGFILSRIVEGQTFEATLYNHLDEVITVLAGTSEGLDADGDEIFYGYVGEADDPSTWVSRIVITGNNAQQNAGLDNFAFSPLTPVTADGRIHLPVDADTLHYWAFIEDPGTLPSGVVNYGTAAVDGGPRFSDATLGGYATDGEGALLINGVDYGTTLSQSAVNPGSDITGEAWFRWDIEWNYDSTPPQPRDVFLIHRVDGVAGNIFRFAVEDPTSAASGVNIFFDGSGVGGGRLLVDNFDNDATGVSLVYGVLWNEEGELESLEAYYSQDGGVVFHSLNPTLGDSSAANLGEIRVHAKGDFSEPGDWFRLRALRVGSSAHGVGLPELPVDVDPEFVFNDRPLWDRFADKDLVPGQGIDGFATGEGAAAPEDLEAISGLAVNTEFAGFRPVSETDVNYLNFTNNRSAFQFHIDDDPDLGDEWAGVATHTDALNVSGPAGPEERHAVYLGVLDENWGSYTISVGSISTGRFYRMNADGYPYAVRAAGFVVANVLEGAEIYADFYGIDGSLLTTLQGTGTAGQASTLDGDEIFFGFDAGSDDPLKWISRIALRGVNNGQAGFDDFGFSPVVAVAPDGTVIEAPSFVEDEVAVGGLVEDAPLFNTFATRNPLTAAGQGINRVARGPGSHIVEENFVNAPTGMLAAAYLREKWRATVHRGVSEGQVSIVGNNGNRVMRVLYPEGSLAEGGAQWVSDIGRTDEATAEYRFRFEPGYHFTTGGKLPGLAGGTRATGGNPNPHGFSARYMWNSSGGIFLYLYHSEQPGIYGQGIGLGNARATIGEWHHIKQRVKLNDPGEPNGILQVWFDGELVLDRQDMRWRLEGADWDIDTFFFSTFHGGGSDDYRPERDNHIYFDDFKVVPADRSGVALSMEGMENLPGMRVNTDWQAGGERFVGKGTQVVSHNALHYNDSGTGVLFTLNHLGVGSNPNSGATTAGLRETVTGPNAVYVGFIDDSFVEYSLTLGAFDHDAGVFRSSDEEGRPYVARALGFILSGINDRAEMRATFYNASGDALATLSGLGNAENGSSGIEIFYGHDAGPDPENWIRKVTITGSNPNPYGGSRNIGLDDLGFTPITILGEEPAVIPVWSDYEYPHDEEGWRAVGLGWIYDAFYPWIYHHPGSGWMYVAPESGLYSQYHYIPESEGWIKASELWGPFHWDFSGETWMMVE